MTSLTTLLVVFSLFFFGGEVIHDFAFALIVGIVVGTYSSIYIASPVMLSLEGRFETSDEEMKKLEAKP
jgi:preprotein translocase subunit SecF